MRTRAQQIHTIDVRHSRRMAVTLTPTTLERRVMTKEGVLQRQPDGRWAIVRKGHSPHEITSGELFRVEVRDGIMKPTRMEYAQAEGGTGGDYYSVHGYALRDGLRAAMGET